MHVNVNAGVLCQQSSHSQTLLAGGRRFHVSEGAKRGSKDLSHTSNVYLIIKLNKADFH